MKKLPEPCDHAQFTDDRDNLADTLFDIEDALAMYHNDMVSLASGAVRPENMVRFAQESVRHFALLVAPK